MLIRYWLCFTVFFSVPIYGQWLTHDLGQTFLAQPAKRVVALNWSQTEMLLTLGITPVGVADMKGYRFWQSNHPPLPEFKVNEDGKSSVKIIELGHRGVPSLSAIMALKPDLIIGYRFRHAKIYQQLQKIAPTLIFNQYPQGTDQTDYLQRMQRIFKTVAQATDKAVKAEQVLAAMHQRIANAQQQLIARGRQGEITVMGKFVGMGLGLRVYSDQALSGALINKLGLVNAWPEGTLGRDFSHLQLAQLTQLQCDNFIYVGDLQRQGGKMVNSPLWQRLSFVKQQRLYAAPTLWNFGGPVSAARMAEVIVARLLSQYPEEQADG